jgi:hypothetical protein
VGDATKAIVGGHDGRAALGGDFFGGVRREEVVDATDVG